MKNLVQFVLESMLSEEDKPIFDALEKSSTFSSDLNGVGMQYEIGGFHYTIYGEDTDTKNATLPREWSSMYSEKPFRNCGLKNKEATGRILIVTASVSHTKPNEEFTEHEASKYGNCYFIYNIDNDKLLFCSLYSADGREEQKELNNMSEAAVSKFIKIVNPKTKYDSPSLIEKIEKVH